MIVKFNASVFRNRYPRLTDNGKEISDEALEWQFRTACTVIRNPDDTAKEYNSRTGIIPYSPDDGVFDREILLYALTCHFVALSQRDPGQSGPIASASQGSVSVSYTSPANMGYERFYAQTPCGEAFYNMLKGYTVRGGLAVHLEAYHPYG